MVEWLDDEGFEDVDNEVREENHGVGMVDSGKLGEELDSEENEANSGSGGQRPVSEGVHLSLWL